MTGACRHVRDGAKPVATAAYWMPAPLPGEEAAGSISCCKMCAGQIIYFIEALRLRSAEAAEGDGE